VLEVMDRVVVGRIREQVEPPRFVPQERNDRDQAKAGCSPSQ
jgi:hypothetical protein